MIRYLYVEHRPMICVVRSSAPLFQCGVVADVMKEYSYQHPATRRRGRASYLGPSARSSAAWRDCLRGMLTDSHSVARDIKHVPDSFPPVTSLASPSTMHQTPQTSSHSAETRLSSSPPSSSSPVLRPLEAIHTLRHTLRDRAKVVILLMHLTCAF
jgi:hypothetical protein